MTSNTQDPLARTEKSSLLSKLNPFEQLNVITKAIKAVPAVKWALGVAGVLAALSLGLMFFKSAPAAIAGAIAMMFLMVLLRVIAEAVRDRSNNLRLPVLAVVWTVVLLFIGFCGTTFSSIAFGKPLEFQDLVGRVLGTAEHKPVVEQTQASGGGQEFVFTGQDITPDKLPPEMTR